MIGVVIVSHGRVGAEMKSTVEAIVGTFDSSAAVSLESHENIEGMKEKIGRAVKDVDDGDGVLILTDMFGGTPSNLSLPLMEDGKVEVVTGFNLPMLVKLATIRNESKDLGAAASFICAYGQRNITVASDLLRVKKEAGA